MYWIDGNVIYGHVFDQRDTAVAFIQPLVAAPTPAKSNPSNSLRSGCSKFTHRKGIQTILSQPGSSSLNLPEDAMDMLNAAELQDIHAQYLMNLLGEAPWYPPPPCMYS